MKSAELTTKSRNRLDDSSFAIPRLRALPLSDASHVRNALARFNQVKGATDAEKATAKRKIRAAAKRFGIDVSEDFAEFAKYGEPLLVAMAEQPVAAADFREGKPLPYVRVGEHAFTDDVGEVHITDADLDRLVEGFQRNARRQDLALINEEHLPAVYNHAGEVQMGPGAIGWIKDLYRDGDTVYMVPDWNAAGERLLEDDRYRGVSPELFLDWTDPETGESWGLTAVGAALTNRPRMKNLAHQGGPIDDTLAAREGHVLAFAELADVHLDTALPDLSISYAYPDRKRLPLHSPEAVKGSQARFMAVDASEPERDEAWGKLREAAVSHGVNVPSSWRELKASEAASLLMQEADAAGDDAGLSPPCQYQPPYGDCPGYTRSDPDNDGDADCCALAAKGCNGYLPLISRASFVAPNAAAYGYGEYRQRRLGGQMQKQDTDGKEAQTSSDQPVQASEPAATDAATANTVTVPATHTATSATAPQTITWTAGNTSAAPAVGQKPADFAEVERILAAERHERQELAKRLEGAESRAKEADDRARRMEAAAEMAKVADRVDALKRSGRITPAEAEQFGESFAKFAEDDLVLRVLESRPEGQAVDLRERGSGEDEQLDERAKLDLLAKKFREAEAARGNRISARDALLHVGKYGYQPQG